MSGLNSFNTKTSIEKNGDFFRATVIDKEGISQTIEVVKDSSGINLYFLSPIKDDLVICSFGGIAVAGYYEIVKGPFKGLYLASKGESFVFTQSDIHGKGVPFIRSEYDRETRKFTYDLKVKKLVVKLHPTRSEVESVYFQ